MKAKYRIPRETRVLIRAAVKILAAWERRAKVYRESWNFVSETRIQYLATQLLRTCKMLRTQVSSQLALCLYEEREALLRDICDEARLAMDVRIPYVSYAAPTLRGIFDELRALRDNPRFVDFSVDIRRGFVACITRPVNLDGVDFGRFKLIYDWNADRLSESLFVEALQPNPAASDETVTHPHVRGGRVCFGDNAAAARERFAEADFGSIFHIAAGVLDTYTLGRAYVALEEWPNRSCTACGYRRPRDEIFVCACGSYVCDACFGTCRKCAAPICGNCSEKHMDECGAEEKDEGNEKDEEIETTEVETTGDGGYADA